MPSEQPDQKSKAIGKVIVVILCCAILLFLLLPFLDGSASASSAKRGKQKAFPQIFTSNPLSEAASRILSAFNRKSKKEPFGSVLQTPSQEQKQLLATRAPNQTRQNKSTDGSFAQPGGSVSDQDTSNNIPAAFLNEDGEWMLVNQTEPDSSNRGMHDINSSDSAYDKLLRLERQAKWTGHASNVQTENHPDSTWSQIWQPIKEFFGMKGETATAVPVRGLGSSEETASQQPSQLLASSRSSSSRNSKKSANTNPPLSEQEANDLLASLLNPSERLDKTAESLKEMSSDLLSDRDALVVHQQIDERTVAAKKWVETQLATDLAKAAEGQSPEEVVSKAISCTDSASTSMHKESSDACPFYEPMSHSGGLEQQVQALNTANKQMINRALSELTGQNMQNAQINTIIYYGRTEAGQAPAVIEKEEGESEDEVTQRIYSEWLNEVYKSENCDKEPCDWFSIDPDAQIDVTAPSIMNAGGTHAQGLSAKAQYKLFNQFLQDKIKNAATDEEAESYQQIKGENVLLHAWPVRQSQTKQTVAQQGANSIVVGANNAQINTLVQQGIIPASRAFSYDFKQRRIDLANEGTNFSNTFIDKIRRQDELTKQAQKSVSEPTVGEVVPQYLSNELRKTLSK